MSATGSASQSGIGGFFNNARKQIGDRFNEAKNFVVRNTEKAVDETKKAVEQGKQFLDENLPAHTREAAGGAAAAAAAIGTFGAKKTAMTIGGGAAATFAAVAAAGSAYDKLKNGDGSESVSIEAATVGGATNLVGEALRAGTNAVGKFNPVTSVVSGALNGAAASYDANREMSDAEKSKTTKNIEMGISAAGTAAASFGAAKIVAAATGSMLLGSASAFVMPALLGLGIAQGVKVISDAVRG